jgi:predicted amidohydrolase YtcJ
MSETSTSGVSRRNLLKSGAVVGAAAAVGSVAGSGMASAETPPVAPGGSLRRGNLVLTNGRIHTMDARDHVVSTVAIFDGRIAYVGDSVRAAHRHVPSGTRTIDLHGKVALPGLIDCHNHIVLMGNRPGHHTPLENAYSIKQVQSIYAARAAGVKAGEFITTIGGFHFNQFKEVRLPTLAELDAACPHNPVYISVAFEGPSVTNSLGKAFFSSAALPVPVDADGSIATGDPTGRATLALRQQLTFAERKRSVRDAMAYAVSMGVTTHLDQGAFQSTGTPADNSASEDNFTMHLPFLAVYDEGHGIIRLRINYLHEDSDSSLPTLNQRIANAFKFFGNDMVRTGAIGEFIVEPFLFGQTFNDAAVRIAQAGWRAEVHSLTPTDFQSEIQGFELANAQFPITDLRWVVAHVPFITPDYVARLKKLGGGINLTGWNYLAGTGPQSGPPYRMIFDSGIPVGMSSDGMQIAPMNPFIHCYFATTGINALGQQINPGQQIDRHQAMKHYTRSNGWFLGDGDEDQLGSLEAGRLGDVVVLNKDYFTVKSLELKKIHSDLTVLGGQVVHRAG